MHKLEYELKKLGDEVSKLDKNLGQKLSFLAGMSHDYKVPDYYDED